MTDEQLAEIEARANAATPGPWFWTGRVDDWGHSGPDLMGPNDAVVCQSWGHDADGLEIADSDMSFIANAREDIPALIAEIRRLRSQ